MNKGNVLRKRAGALFLTVALCATMVQGVFAAEPEDLGAESSVVTETPINGSDSSDAGLGEQEPPEQESPVGKEGQKSDSDTPETDVDGQSDNSENQVLENTAEEQQSNAQSVEENDSTANILASYSDTKPSGCGDMITDMTTDENLFLTLVDNQSYRWNVDGLGAQGEQVHLDYVDGLNCNFQLRTPDDGGEGWYGIKFIRDGGTDRYVDIEGKSDDEDKILHVWEEKDKELNQKNPHRLFAFYDAGTDSHGNKMYYIQVKKSGLWVGLHNNSASQLQNLVQTNASHAKKWYITPCVVPTRSNQTKVVGEADNSAFCELFINGTVDSINIVGQAGYAFVDGMTLQKYNLGTSIRWALNWHEKYQAYEIEAVHEEAFKNSTAKTNMVWDTRGEGGKSYNTDLVLWHKQSKDKNYNTSQLFRFIKLGNGKYHIVNAKSGRPIGEKTSTAVTYLALTSSAGLEFDVQDFWDEKNTYLDQSRTDESLNWMKNVPDDTLLSSVNIPGSHDAGTAAGRLDGNIVTQTWSSTRCQKYFFEEQLFVGARSFDIRCDAKKSAKEECTTDDVNIIHGTAQAFCSTRDGDNLSLSHILNYSRDFLKNHSSETVVLLIKPDAGSEDGLVRALTNYIAANNSLFWLSDEIPTMKEARGKIVLMRRFNIDTNLYNPADNGVSIEAFGPNLVDWDNHDFDQQKKAIQIYSTDTANVYAQDAYGEFLDSKWNFIEGTMRQTTDLQLNPRSYVFNYTSSAAWEMIDMARSINKWLYEDKANRIDNRFLGMVMLNFLDYNTCSTIYKSNYDGKFFEPDVIFPKKIEVTHGEPLSTAVMEGMNDCPGVFTFEDPDYIVNYDKDNGKTFPLTFTPDDNTLRSVTASVQVTVKPPTLTVQISNHQITFGEDIPEFMYTLKGSNLADGDELKDLNIKLHLKDPVYTTDGKLKTGEYVISGTANTEKYNVEFEEGILTVKEDPAKTTTVDANKPKATTTSNSPTSVKTGDEAPFAIYLVILALSGAIVLGAWIAVKRKRKTK